MNKRNIYVLFIYAMLLSVAGFGQTPTDSERSRKFGASVRALQELTAISPVYREEVLNLLIAEANKVAKELNLPETLPITETNLISRYLTPPQLVPRLGGAVGNVSTPNYEYYCSVGGKFSFLRRTGLEREYAKFRREWLLPMSKMDTNAACQLAVAWLSQAKIDVQSLNRDCDVRIVAHTPQGEKGKQFVPVYWVYWKRRAQPGSAASVQLFAPDRILLELRVEDSKYILRQPLQVHVSK